MSDKDFRKMLEAVPGSYDDFVNCLVSYVTENEDRQMIADFIRENPDKNSGYVLEFYSDNIWDGSED